MRERYIYRENDVGGGPRPPGMLKEGEGVMLDETLDYQLTVDKTVGLISRLLIAKSL